MQTRISYSVDPAQHYECLMYNAEAMLKFKEKDAKPPTPEATRNRARQTLQIQQLHQPVAVKDIENARCSVCRLEHQIIPSKVNGKGLKSNLVMCSCCGVTAHNYVVTGDSSRWIHQVENFANKTCFDILHTEVGFQLWCRNTEIKKWAAKARVSHRVYKDIREMHGLPRDLTRAPRKRKSSDDNDEE